MQNGYFQLVKTPGGFGVRLIPPVDGGEEIRISELMHYLDSENVVYDTASLKRAVEGKSNTVCFLGTGECPAIDEHYQLDIDSDYMSASARFIPPSETGKRLTFDEFINDLRYRNVFFGIQMQALQDHFMSEGCYCTDLPVAKGREPQPGIDDRIEYYFNTDIHVQPTMQEDGSVDYFNLNIINHCKKEDVLARIIPGKSGEAGMNIMGKRLAPKEQKRVSLKYGKNIQLSEDRLSITSMVDGHVTLVESTVFVSDVYEVQNVDMSTGNIEYTGSVTVNGNVASNFVVKAGGNVVINGIVEGAQIIAGGNVIIARGMNGMGKGVLKAGGDVVAKFIENATVEADGYVNAESILHSNVSAGTEITVSGRRGFITGGHVQANNQITVKTLGAVMGASTVVEVGVNPKVKASYAQLQKEITELVKEIKAAQPILTGFAEKRAKGARFTEDQLKYIRSTAQNMERQNAELQQKNAKLKEIQKNFDFQNHAKVVVRGEVYPGTTIIIGELSMVVQRNYQFCKFEVVQGDVRSVSL